MTDLTTPQYVLCDSVLFKIEDGKRIWLTLPPPEYVQTDGTKYCPPQVTSEKIS